MNILFHLFTCPESGYIIKVLLRYTSDVLLLIQSCKYVLLQNKVSSVVFLAGPSTEDLKRLKQLDVENRHTGWLSCCVTEPGQIVLKLELKGPDNSLRLRQVGTSMIIFTVLIIIS